MHVRIAAQQGPGSEAHERLKRCLDVLWDQRQCLAPRAARTIILDLMHQLHVDIQTSGARSDYAATTDRQAPGNTAVVSFTTFAGGVASLSQHPAAATALNLDMDAILQSFDLSHYDAASFPLTSAPNINGMALRVADCSSSQTGKVFDGFLDPSSLDHLPDPLLGFCMGDVDLNCIEQDLPTNTRINSPL